MKLLARLAWALFKFIVFFIPLGILIVAAPHFVDALQAHSIYKQALSVEYSKSIKCGAETLYDELCVTEVGLTPVPESGCEHPYTLIHVTYNSKDRAHFE
jgi:hypothetical protein